jgi:hypothetical protein
MKSETPIVESDLHINTGDEMVTKERDDSGRRARFRVPREGLTRQGNSKDRYWFICISFHRMKVNQTNKERVSSEGLCPAEGHEKI